MDIGRIKRERFAQKRTKKKPLLDEGAKVLGGDLLFHVLPQYHRRGRA